MDVIYFYWIYRWKKDSDDVTSFGIPSPQKCKYCVKYNGTELLKYKYCCCGDMNGCFYAEGTFDTYCSIRKTCCNKQNS
ncbi:hypothetical protein R6Q59_012439 [Mikania micrantha]